MTLSVYEDDAVRRAQRGGRRAEHFLHGDAHFEHDRVLVMTVNIVAAPEGNAMSDRSAASGS